MIDFNLFSKAPEGDLYTKWEDYKSSLKKLSPEEANKYKLSIESSFFSRTSSIFLPTLPVAPTIAIFMIMLKLILNEG